MPIVRFFIVFFFSAFPFLLGAQNLVPNPGFEELIDCPNNSTGMYLAHDWFSPTNGTSDIFNACHPMSGGTICPLDTGNTYLDPWQWAVPTNVVGCQEPYSGNGYAGLYVYALEDSREYIQVELLEELEFGETYYVQFYLSAADRMQYATDAIHIGFIADSIQYSTNFNYDFGIDLQNNVGNYLVDMDNWIQMDWEFVAEGNEKHIVIGNFLNNQNTDIDTINTPALGYYSRSYYYIDDVYVGTENPNSIDETGIDTEITIFPNPSSDIINIDSNGIYKARLYDIRGNAIREFTLQAGRNELESKSLANGVYILKIGENASSYLKIVVQH